MVKKCLICAAPFIVLILLVGIWAKYAKADPGNLMSDGRTNIHTNRPVTEDDFGGSTGNYRIAIDGPTLISVLPPLESSILERWDVMRAVRLIGAKRELKQIIAVNGSNGTTALVIIT